MTRKHRAAHRLIWPLLALFVGVLFVAALVMRPPPANSAAGSVSSVWRGDDSTGRLR